MVAFNEGQFPTIAVINKATVPLGVDFSKLIKVSQKFLDTIFVPIWGYPAKLVQTTVNIPNSWAIVLLDTADQAGALGYHDLTVEGQPISKVFVKTTLADKQKVSTTFIHELCEMLIDPGVQLWAAGPKGVFYAYEMCDAVEEEEFDLDGITISDFVTPAFFESWQHPPGTKFDYLGKVTKPFQTLHGGYQVTMRGGRIKNVFGSTEKAARFRKENRKLHRSEYRKLMVDA